MYMTKTAGLLLVLVCVSAMAGCNRGGSEKRQASDLPRKAPEEAPEIKKNVDVPEPSPANKTAAIIEKFGGRAWPSFPKSDKEITEVDFNSPRLGKGDLACVKDLIGLKKLHLFSAKITNDDLKYLA